MAGMYKDIYSYIETKNHVDSNRMIQVKGYAVKKKCSDIQALLECKVCNKEEISEAVKNVYNIDTFEGKINDVSPIKEMPMSTMINEGFMVLRDVAKMSEMIVLITNPQSRIKIINIIKLNNLVGNMKFKFIFYDEMNEWKMKNAANISNQKLNAAASNIEGNHNSEGGVYEATEEELNDEGVVGIINNMINDAVNAGASDIHIEPNMNSIKIRLRVDGILREHTVLNYKNIHSNLVNRIKIMAGMDTNNFQTPQSGKINMQILGKEVDMRISTLPSLYGEKVTIRILVSQNVAIRSLEQLGFKPKMCEQIRYLTDHPYGIILVTGPTGSGKSSTLASVIKEISNSEQNTITIEDPVEFRIDGITQVNVNEKIGLTFASVLREILRQDPDIIMVGEIRDTETAKIAITASNTGHLVFSTLHTNNSVSVIPRLSDMGVEPYLVADSLIGVISQRLVKVLCENCKKPYTVTEEDMKKFKLPSRMKGKQVWKPCGCMKCNKGYDGRTIVPELLEITDEIKEAIHKGQSSKFITDIAKKNGMVTQHDYAYNLALEGKTSLQEIYRVFGGVSNEETSN